MDSERAWFTLTFLPPAWGFLCGFLFHFLCFFLLPKDFLKSNWQLHILAVQGPDAPLGFSSTSDRRSAPLLGNYE